MRDLLSVSLDEWSSLKVCWMIARILRRGLSDEDNVHLPPIKGQLTSAPLPLPNTKGSAGEKAVRATATVGATPMTPFSSTKEGGESEAKKLNQHDIQSDTSQYHAQTEQPQRYRSLKTATGEGEKPPDSGSRYPRRRESATGEGERPPNSRSRDSEDAPGCK